MMARLTENEAFLDDREITIAILNSQNAVAYEEITGSKQHNLQAVELSQRTQAAVQIVSNLPVHSNGGQIYRFLGMSA